MKKEKKKKPYPYSMYLKRVIHPSKKEKRKEKKEKKREKDTNPKTQEHLI